MIKVNGKKIEFKTFPNGETLFDASQLKTPFAYQERNYVDFKYETDSDLMNLLFVKRFIDNSIRRNDAWKLNITYMPYSRMDRSEGGSAFTLKYVADFINALNFYEVEILEPHSEVTPAVINNCTSKSIVGFLVERILNNHITGKNNFYLCYPDTGAEKRYSKEITNKFAFSYFKGVLVGIKKRDFKTGKILQYKMVGDENLNGADVVIVDDLCSRGGTFALASEELKKMGVGKIYLAVGHCENTIIDGDLLKTNSNIEKVYTTDSILNADLIKKGVENKVIEDGKIEIVEI